MRPHHPEATQAGCVQIEIPLDEWSEVPPFLAFLREREIDARLAEPPECTVVIEPAPADPAAIEVFVALHTWVDAGGSRLTLRADGREYTLHEQQRAPAASAAQTAILTRPVEGMR
jgi:hypothetical protein